jgi:hypothetical protein
MKGARIMLVATKSKTPNLRLASVAASVVLGSALAFLLGAQAGARLDHKTRSVTISAQTVAHTPVAADVIAHK